MSEPVILLRDVTKAFGAKQVLRGVSLEVERGATVALLGASGSGKSVTLKTVNGLIPPDSGEVTVLGHPVATLTEQALAPLRRRVSYLFQGGALFDSMSVFDNVAYPLREHGRLDPGELRERVAALLGVVRLDDVGSLQPSELSGGMRKRAAIARALALEPEIMLYDEPTTGLDPVTGGAIADLIVDLDRRFGVTSLVVTHDIPLVQRVAERVVFLHDGAFIFSGSVEAAWREGPDPVREFFAAGGIHA
ncbi:MAG TPA: ATP-binding cassette domain-containing protein [Thermoanaerobaculales bacterium]|nr:ATP-binding cassette domain-containing protein [Thermoanaerobaculales bacterium]